MKRWQWIVVILGLCLLSVIFINCPNCFNTGYVQLSNAQEVFAQKQVKPEPLTRIWGTNSDLCFRLKPVPTYADTLKFLIDGYPAFQRWIEFPAYNFCGQSLEHLNVGQHVARIEFKSPSGEAYSYTWVFEVKADGIVPEVMATAAP